MQTEQSLPEITGRVKELIGDLLDIAPGDIEAGDAILDDGTEECLRLDSLDALKLALALADEYGLRDPVEIDWEQVRTVEDAALFVYRLTAGP